MAATEIGHLEKIAGEDKGNRGMGPLLQLGELENAVRCLFNSKSVAILTGYPCCLHEPPTETDGPLGAVAMARALNALGLRAVLLTDRCNEAPVSAALQASLDAYPAATSNACSVQAFPGGAVDAQKIVQDYELDALIAIERPGPAIDGGYYTMKGRDMSQTVEIAKLEQLLDLRAQDGTRLLKSAGIGDGGNELGMGKRKDLVCRHVPLGGQIGSVAETDYLIAAGVSNWGGCAVSFALYSLFKELESDNEGRLSTLRSVLPRCDAELAVLQAMVAAGARDGITGKAEPTVDDLAWSEHASVISAMREAVKL